jgi:NADPH-dependent ferric siderophore reductase
LAERLGVSVWELEVVGVSDPTPSMRTISFACTAPASLAYEPGNDLMLAFPIGSNATIRRRYSIRRVDPVARTVDLQFVRHGDGPAARWAEAAEAGQRLTGVGPRGKVTIDPVAPWHLFVADDAFIPAASSMIESLPPWTAAFVYFEVGDAPDELPIVAEASVAGPGFLYRHDTPPGTSTALIDALATFRPPPGAGRAYIGGEHKVTNELRKVLLKLGMAPEQIAAKPYWRVGRANAERGEPPREQ